MLDFFDYYGHICIAFTMLGLSVFDFLVSSAFLLAYSASSVSHFNTVNLRVSTGIGDDLWRI